MSFIENNLSPREKLMIKPNVHWFVLVNGPLIALTGAMLRSEAWGAYAGNYLYNSSTKNVWWTLTNYTFDDIVQATVGALPYVAILVGVFLTALGFLRKFGIEMGVTSRRVIFKEGMFHNDMDELSFKDIESIEVHQSPFGKLLDYGDITFNGVSYNTTKRGIVFRWVCNPAKVRRNTLAGLDAYAPTPTSLE